MSKVFQGFLGFSISYAMRVNLSVAIVYMVNNTAINGNEYRSSEVEADKDKDGPFVWDEAQQGVILGMFFYGYVVTQVSIANVLPIHLHTNKKLSGSWRQNGRDCGRKMAFWRG